jgi:hypothetical protein
VARAALQLDAPAQFVHAYLALVPTISRRGSTWRTPSTAWGARTKRAPPTAPTSGPMPPGRTPSRSSAS